MAKSKPPSKNKKNTSGDLVALQYGEDSSDQGQARAKSGNFSLFSGINGPFAGLADLGAKLKARQREDEYRKKEELKKARKEDKLARSKGQRETGPGPERDLDGKDEQEIFMRAMEGVVPLPNNKRFVPEPLPPDRWKLPSTESEDILVLRNLFDLVNGKSEFDFSATDELNEAQVKGLPLAIMEQLRQGLIPYQDHLDLHGLTLPEAEEAINKFITRNVYLGRSCLLLVHGRGHRSPDGIPIIKRNLESLLLKGPVKQYILAYTTAKPVDGGSGASYILLRG
jgi:DNA-nicking Smr family endonuclease